MKIAHISLSDWAGAATGMSFEEEGFFWRMTRLMYANDAVFADNDRDNASIMGADIRTYRRLKKRMLTKVGPRKAVIKIVDGCIINKRVIEEIEKFCEAQKKASEIGKIGAEARWRNHNSRQDVLYFQDKSAGSRPEVGWKFDAETAKINDLEMPTPTPVSKLHRKKESPIAPKAGDGKEIGKDPDREADLESEFKARLLVNNRLGTESEKRAARAEQAKAQVPHEAKEQASVVWDDQGRLQASEEFRAELLGLLKKVPGVDLDLVLAEAAGNGKASPHHHGIALRRAVLAHVAFVVRVTKTSAEARAVYAPKPSGQRHKANPDAAFMANQEAGMAIRDHLWGRSYAPGFKLPEPTE